MIDVLSCHVYLSGSVGRKETWGIFKPCICTNRLLCGTFAVDRSPQFLCGVNLKQGSFHVVRAFWRETNLPLLSGRVKGVEGHRTTLGPTKVLLMAQACADALPGENHGLAECRKARTSDEVCGLREQTRPRRSSSSRTLFWWSVFPLKGPERMDGWMVDDIAPRLVWYCGCSRLTYR